jgi:hypothetical protein
MNKSHLVGKLLNSIFCGSLGEEVETLKNILAIRNTTAVMAVYPQLWPVYK